MRSKLTSTILWPITLGVACVLLVAGSVSTAKADLTAAPGFGFDVGDRPVEFRPTDAVCGDRPSALHFSVDEGEVVGLANGPQAEDLGGVWEVLQAVAGVYGKGLSQGVQRKLVAVGLPVPTRREDVAEEGEEEVVLFPA